ncbi:putative ribonuclease H-like domain-containing protein [Tanacetum coccineum]
MKAVKDKMFYKTVDSWFASSKNLWKLVRLWVSSTVKMGLGYGIKSNVRFLDMRKKYSRGDHPLKHMEHREGLPSKVSNIDPQLGVAWRRERATGSTEKRLENSCGFLLFIETASWFTESQCYKEESLLKKPSSTPISNKVSPGHIEAVAPSAHNVEEVFSDDDDDEMPEIRIYDKSSEVKSLEILIHLFRLEALSRKSLSLMLYLNKESDRSLYEMDAGLKAYARRTVAVKLNKGFIVYQMDVKSDFCMALIDEEVYVSQTLPWVLLILDHLQRCNMVVKALYGLHQAPRSCRFQMSSMGELTFFLGLQVKQNKDGIFISQDKYVAEMLKKFDLVNVKAAITPMETKLPLTKDEDAFDVDVHLYRSMIGIYQRLLISIAVKRIFKYSRRNPTWDNGIPQRWLSYFFGQRLILFMARQENQTIVAYSHTTEAEGAYGCILGTKREAGI